MAKSTTSNGFVIVIEKVGERPSKIYPPDILYDQFINFYYHENVETC